ncbi:3-oxo-tetronate 4-phosphate decarboxylase [Paraglaciecola sp. L3A3]|uniref:3-oxo-tetronate 4-phosphate decarboxylase n=1 Tax=Paraglaciecola sp. L3A3 TaxID=2686358 RepID=UPI00131CF895|nr:3-oxo-tetronate 4-phosphate decarboxylase [Paraglaciecola sp. L3A3]
MFLDEHTAKQQIVAFAKSIFDRGLTSGASANMSVRIENAWVMTPTNTCFGFLNAEELSVVGLDGTLLKGLPPSKEFRLHKAMYDQRPNDRCIIHLHSTYATALSCISATDNSNVVPTFTPYLTMRLGPIAMVPYFAPGDDALAESVGKVAAKHAGIIMANHGPIVSAETVESCVYGMEELEESCKLALLLKNENANTLTAEQINFLLNKFKK